MKLDVSFFGEFSNKTTKPHVLSFQSETEFQEVIKHAECFSCPWRAPIYEREPTKRGYAVTISDGQCRPGKLILWYPEGHTQVTTSEKFIGRLNERPHFVVSDLYQEDHSKFSERVLIGSTDSTLLADIKSDDVLRVTSETHVLRDGGQSNGLRKCSVYWTANNPGLLFLGNRIRRKNGNAASHQQEKEVEEWQHSYIHLAPDLSSSWCSWVAQYPADLSSSARALKITSILLHQNPEDGALALSVTNSNRQSCLVLLNANLELRCHLKVGPHAEDTGSLESGPSSLAWIPGTTCLAVMDSKGTMRFISGNGKEEILLYGRKLTSQVGGHRADGSALKCAELMSAHWCKQPGFMSRLMGFKRSKDRVYQLCTPWGSSQRQAKKPAFLPGNGHLLETSETFTFQGSHDSKEPQVLVSDGRHFVVFSLESSWDKEHLQLQCTPSVVTKSSNEGTSSWHQLCPLRNQDGGDGLSAAADVASVPSYGSATVHGTAWHRRLRIETDLDKLKRTEHESAKTPRPKDCLTPYGGSGSEGIVVGLSPIPRGSSLVSYMRAGLQHRLAGEQKGSPRSSIVWRQLAASATYGIMGNRLRRSSTAVKNAQSGDGLVEPSARATPKSATPKQTPPRDSSISSIFLLEQNVLNALQAGDAELLQGKPLQSLNFYADAHAFGFLPCFLVLLRTGWLDRAVELLFRFSAFVSLQAPSHALIKSSMSSISETPAHGRQRESERDAHTPRSLEKMIQMTLSGSAEKSADEVRQRDEQKETNPDPVDDAALRWKKSAAGVLMPLLQSNPTMQGPASGPDSSIEKGTGDAGQNKHPGAHLLWSSSSAHHASGGWLRRERASPETEELDTMMQAAYQQLAVAYQCLAYVSCTLRHLSEDNANRKQKISSVFRQAFYQSDTGPACSQSTASQTTGKVLPSDFTPLTPLSMRSRSGVGRLRYGIASPSTISLPAPIVWHPLEEPGPGNVDLVAGQQSSPRLAPSLNGQAPSPSKVSCYFRLCHSAFDVGGLIRHPSASIPTEGKWPTELRESALSAQSSLQSTSPSKTPLSLPGLAQNRAKSSADSREGNLRMLSKLRDPAFAAGLLAAAHACEFEVQKQIAFLPPYTRQPCLNTRAETPQQVQPQQGGPRSSQDLAPVIPRVNWRLLHQYPSAARQVAVWREAGDMRRAVVLAFTVHNILKKQPRAFRHLAAGRPSLQISCVQQLLARTQGLMDDSDDNEEEGVQQVVPRYCTARTAATQLEEPTRPGEEEAFPAWNRTGAHADCRSGGQNEAVGGTSTCREQEIRQPVTSVRGKEQADGQSQQSNDTSDSCHEGQSNSSLRWSGSRLLKAMAQGRARNPVVPPPGSCLQIGWSIIEEQMAPEALASKDVKDACCTLNQLVSIPLFILGPGSYVYRHLLQKASLFITDLLGRRQSSSPLVNERSQTHLVFSFEAIAAQLHANLARALFLELRQMRHMLELWSSTFQRDEDCSGGATEGILQPQVGPLGESPADVAHHLFGSEEVEATLMMLMQWRGRSGSDSELISQVGESFSDIRLEGPLDWQPQSLLSLVQAFLLDTKTLPYADVAAVMGLLEAQFMSETLGGSQENCGRRALDEARSLQPEVPRPSLQRKVSPFDTAFEQLLDLSDVALLVDSAQIMASTLHCLQPHIVAAAVSPHWQAAFGAEQLSNFEQSRNGDPGESIQAMLRSRASDFSSPGRLPEVVVDDEQSRLVVSCLEKVLDVNWVLTTHAHVTALQQRLSASRKPEGPGSPIGAHSEAPFKRSARPVEQSNREKVEENEGEEMAGLETTWLLMEAMLLMWMCALVQADVYHPHIELQAIVLSSLRIVSGAGLSEHLVENSSKLLREKRILNARIAEQLSRLQQVVASADEGLKSIVQEELRLWGGAEQAAGGTESCVRDINLSCVRPRAPFLVAAPAVVKAQVQAGALMWVKHFGWLRQKGDSNYLGSVTKPPSKEGGNAVLGLRSSETILASCEGPSRSLLESVCAALCAQPGLFTHSPPSQACSLHAQVSECFKNPFRVMGQREHREVSRLAAPACRLPEHLGINCSFNALYAHADGDGGAFGVQRAGGTMSGEGTSAAFDVAGVCGGDYGKLRGAEGAEGAEMELQAVMNCHEWCRLEPLRSGHGAGDVEDGNRCVETAEPKQGRVQQRIDSQPTNHAEEPQAWSKWSKGGHDAEGCVSSSPTSLVDQSEPGTREDSATSHPRPFFDASISPGHQTPSGPRLMIDVGQDLGGDRRSSSSSENQLSDETLSPGPPYLHGFTYAATPGPRAQGCVEEYLRDAWVTPAPTPHPGPAGAQGGLGMVYDTPWEEVPEHLRGAQDPGKPEALYEDGISLSQIMLSPRDGTPPVGRFLQRLHGEGEIRAQGELCGGTEYNALAELPTDQRMLSQDGCEAGTSRPLNLPAAHSVQAQEVADHNP